MILQALTKYYDALLTQGAISPPGWCDAKVSYALHIGENGELLDVFSLKQPSPDGKREVPQILRVPEQTKRAVNVASNFLCDNSSYLLGIDAKASRLGPSSALRRPAPCTKRCWQMRIRLPPGRPGLFRPVGTG